ncbi:MAG: hypothetical protein GXP39_13990, partial [Chloroflexi bacterium]|nr:hypothetical protein [Chloroflexota bacterium]
SEVTTIADRPKLDICYTLDTSDVTCVTIQRGTDGDVYDAYIWQANPTYNGGTSDTLWTGLLYGGEKYSLLQFDFAGAPPTAVNLSTFTANASTSQPWAAIAVLAVGIILLGGTITARRRRS